MNFLKTLLAYMALTFTVSVQTTCTPEITPVPTPSPTPEAVISTQLPTKDPYADIAPVSATPAPAPKAHPTPNRAYKTLTTKSRGDDVKRMQERLIELGYLNDKADGAYGAKTKKAVQKFQYYNGLSQDGVAGKATLTVLFEDPNVVADPSLRTTPAPESPESSQEPSGSAEADENSLSTEAPEEEAGPEEIPDASIVINDSGEPLTCLRKEDGVYIHARPRVYRYGDDLRVCLEDLCASVSGWTLDTAGEDLLFSADDREILIRQTATGTVVTVNGETADVSADEVLRVGGLTAVSPALLRETLKADVLWDEEEKTIMIRLSSQDGAGEEG